MDAGHFIDRRYLPTKFDERNVHPQCKKCNQMEDGNIKAYEYYLIGKYGPDILDELWDKALNGPAPDFELINQKTYGF